MTKKNKKRAFLKSKLIIIFAIIILITFSIALTREIIRKLEINSEIAGLENEINKLEDQNTELADLIEYLNSTSWQEKEARNKLNLQAPGESVIAIIDNSIIEESTNGDNGNDIADNQGNKTSNPQKWFKYFFN